MRECLKTGQVAICEECEGMVKPDIVFFGESVRSEPRGRLKALEESYRLTLTILPAAATLSPVCP